MLRPMIRWGFLLALLIGAATAAAPARAAGLSGAAVSEDSTGAALRYQDPPPAIRKVLDAPALPILSVSPACDGVLLQRGKPYPPIADLAQPMLRLAGIRLDPAINGPHRAPYWDRLSYQSVRGGPEHAITLPEGARIGPLVWSADGARVAFSNTIPGRGVELWVLDTKTLRAKRLEGVRVNAGLGWGFLWMPDQRSLEVMLVPADRGPAPPDDAVPLGPEVQEASGKHGIGSTYEARDVMRTPEDEARFDYYLTAEPAVVNTDTGAITSLHQRGIFARLEPSPDGEYFLTERIKRPYSYLHQYDRFPRDIEIWDRTGKKVATVASLPLMDQVPIQGEPMGPREEMWRPTAPAMLLWPEALDKGDPTVHVPHRDKIMTWAAPFTGEPSELMRLEERYAGVSWGEAGKDAIIYEFNRERRWERAFWIRPGENPVVKRTIWDLSVNEKYADPGQPVIHASPSGTAVMQQDGDWIWLVGPGSTPEGDRPFLDRFNLKTGETTRLFRSDHRAYETFAGFVDPKRGEFLTKHENPKDPPNIWLRSLGRARKPMPGEAARESTPKIVTRVPDPTPQLRGIEKRIVTYKREDGVPLSFTLYTPPGYRKGTRLPTVMWAYPLEYSDAATAGQVGGSDQKFTTFSGASPLFFLLDGYAILMNATMPTVAHPDSVYDQFVPQLVSSAKAAIDKAVSLGVTDRNRVGIAGHSHGGRMAANLLAHSDLFRAGIARSGAYNQTLVPFGFQGERRTFYEAPDVYLRASAFRYADKIDEPLLLIHGQEDANPGTIPYQSELLYRAIVGTGGTARLVMLPDESHQYESRESVGHTLWEMTRWFDKYVKAKPGYGGATSRAGADHGAQIAKPAEETKPIEHPAPRR
ncbi:MAG TPA: prolyl oligopeptidase family serine peptidase [Candidatus Eisenbacteria bacterium]|nr:prolyl oligopeptidase family serine peptidase [Candidatus Eisenbacteria bacterium]